VIRFFSAVNPANQNPSRRNLLVTDLSAAASMAWSCVFVSTYVPYNRFK